ncbi:MAG: hypothetical protein H7A49_00930 [Akkermansiaceae bacterium]|nr:hypothetical protein [Akkermansiaceae bacterium]
MRTPESRRHPHVAAAGFALPTVLLVVGALLILAVGILIVTGVERSTARSFVDLKKAELAARAAVEEVEAVLLRDAANDDYIVFGSARADDTNNPLPAANQLFLARGKGAGSSYSYKYTPLFSSSSLPPETTGLQTPTPDASVGSDYIEFSPLPTMEPVRTAWVPVRDGKDKVVARYAYYVEDLQGRIDAKHAGNERGPSSSHARTEWPFPAPGINPIPDEGTVHDEIALWAVDPAATESNQGSLAKNLVKNRGLLMTPGSVLAAAGFSPPLTRDNTGLLIDPAAAAAEASLSAVRQESYLEQPVIPFARGIDPSVAGQPKLNLNRLLTDNRSAAVDEMASLIDEALPDFVNRKGGFPDDYLKTLAANALDYADKDNEPTIANGVRGLDAYPLVSEFLMTFKWASVKTQRGRKIVELRATTYVELWNMSDRDVSGQAEVTYECAYTFPLGANPEVSLADLDEATHDLEKKDGFWWHKPVEVSLKPNEYLIVNCGTVVYNIDAGSSAVWVPSPLVLEGETYGSSGSGYRLRWNEVLVDQSRGGIHRNNSSLNYPTNTANQPGQRTRCTIPCHSHTRNGSFRNNMGDPRMAYYNECPQDANAYPDNYSPNRRNIRWGTIYSKDGSTKPKVYGRVMPSEWPDGGHNSPYETNSFYTTDERIVPDDPRFMPSGSSVLRNPDPKLAPMRLSNSGLFFSATELGRVYDPVMWEVSMPSSVNGPWGEILPGTKASSDFGGGNTLRIGRPEHPAFRLESNPGKEAWRLLDLFHAGQPLSEDSDEIEGDLVRIDGHVNINTASRDALRALAIGALKMDPAIEYRTSDNHNTSNLMAPSVSEYEASDTQIVNEANVIADAIIATRAVTPFASPSEIASVMWNGEPAFGNLKLVTDRQKIQRSDSASEEMFGRVYESSTVRSRNFRVWVVAQAVAPTTTGNTNPKVLAEVRRAFTVFNDPGERANDGSIDSTKARLVTIHENDF